MHAAFCWSPQARPILARTMAFANGCLLELQNYEAVSPPPSTDSTTKDAAATDTDTTTKTTASADDGDNASTVEPSSDIANEDKEGEDDDDDDDDDEDEDAEATDDPILNGKVGRIYFSLFGEVCFLARGLASSLPLLASHHDHDHGHLHHVLILIVCCGLSFCCSSVTWPLAVC